MRHPLLLLLVLVLPLLGACGDEGPGAATQTRLHVLAAASLTESFDDLATEFEQAHEGVIVEAVYDNSATLATQVGEGAPADVLATADLETIQKVVDAGHASGLETFAGNTAVLVIPTGNPAEITSFADLDAKQASYVVCVDTAPCGKVAATLLEAGGISSAPKSFEDNVKAVLQKVASGEVDAGIVYATDARAAGDTVRTVEIPGAADHPTGYGIAVAEQTVDAPLAQEFIDLVLGATGQRVLRDAGFGPAP